MGYGDNKVISICVRHLYRITSVISNSGVWVRWCIIKHLITFFQCVLVLCILAGGYLVESRDHGWFYCTIIVQNIDVDELYIIGVRGVEVRCGVLLSK